MFSPQIVDSDAFLDMPASAQSLYFHLGMRADDDGFVGNPKKILRMVGGNDDDLKLLLGKRFILSFENGVIVIKHWRINNLIRKDWYKPTQYLEEKSTLFIKENGSYTEDSKQGLPLVNEITTKPTHRLGKVRLGKDSIEPSGEGSVENSNKLLVEYFFTIKGIANEEPSFYEENGYQYGRVAKDAKDLLEICEGNLEKAKTALDKTKEKVEGFCPEWQISTAIKKFIEL